MLPRSFLFFLLPLSLLPASGLSAQSPSGLPSRDWFLEQNGGAERFFQRLSWAGTEEAVAYEAMVERKDGAGPDFTEVLREGTTENSILLSLPPGTYRYRVRAYNALEQPGSPSSWVYFEIRLPMKPELRVLDPPRLYLEGRETLALSIAGENLLEESVFFLRPRRVRGKDGGPVSPERVSGGETGRADLEFAAADLSLGLWEALAVNPGGLEDSLGPLRIKYAALPQFSVRSVLAPFIPLSGGYLKGAYRKVYEALGFSLALDMAILKTPRTAFGLGVLSLFPSWYGLPGTDSGPAYVHLMGLGLYLFYRQRLPDQRFALTLRLGGGFSLAAGVNAILTNPQRIIPSISLSGGLSFQWFIGESFFAEAGFDLIHLLTPGDSALEYIRPSLGLGWGF
jgi:hypothetical protein